jgi:ATP-dependent helicase/nuclease subunit A
MTGAGNRLPENVIGPQHTASNPFSSVWVAANAGSGKTTVLVDRVMRLMLADVPLPRILCLTFTRAAAAEMKNRLFKKLGEWTALPDAALEEKIFALTGEMVAVDRLVAARRLFARALDVPGGLKIDTIHAFCQSLVGRFPLEAGVAPHVSVMDERLSAELMAESRNRVVAASHGGAHGEIAAALDRLVVQLDESGFDDLMTDLTRMRGRLERGIERHGGLGGAIRVLRARLGLRAGETPQTVAAAACAAGAFDELGLTRAAAALERGTQTDRENAAAIRAFISEPEARPRLLGGAYRRVFLTKDGEPTKKLIPKSVSGSASEPVLLAEQSRLAAVNERLKAARVAESSADLLRLSAAVIVAYDETKSARAVLDYDDLILSAKKLLTRQGGVSWVLYKLDGGIDHILIDEAQDTSPEQWEVVRTLADEFFSGAGAREDIALPRTFFAVGDEKQSIFSFQGADIAEFERMREHFQQRARQASRDFRPVPLDFSFRSVPPVLHAVDRVFSRDPARIGVVPKGESVEHRPIRAGHGGLVEIWPAEKPQEETESLPWDAPLGQTPADSPPARLARKIARLVKGWIENGEMLVSRGRPIAPQDVMVLVRRRGPFFDEMVRALKLCGVPVAGTDRMVLTEQLAVMDLMALAQFVLLPEDGLTLATVLKGPLYGLSDDDLFALAHGRKGTLWTELKSRAGENPLWKAAHDELTAILARADFTAPFEFYAEILGARGGRKRILARLGPEANDPLDEFLSLAIDFAREHPPSLQGFLAWLSRSFIEIKRDLEEARREVRVMTVHGAKGLEAPVVFLPDTCAVPDHRHNARLLIADETLPPLWPGRADNEEAVCAAARGAEKNRRDEEYRRLLYVAMTRACDRLYVCGYEGARERPDDCWYNLIHDALAGEMQTVALADGSKALRMETPQTSPPQAEPGAERAEEAGPLPAWAKAPPAPEGEIPVPLAPSRPAGEEPPAASPLLGDGLAVRRGRAIHRLLELLPALAPAARKAAAQKYLARPVHGFDALTQDKIAEETLAILTDPEFAPLFGPASRAEVPLAGRINRFIVAGQVDRLMVTDSAVQIVDYKTNRPVPERAEETPPAYLKQMAAYRALLAHIYPGRAVRCALLWTAVPLLMPIPEALLDPHAP